MKFLVKSCHVIAAAAIFFSCKKQELIPDNDFGKEVLSAPNGNYWTLKTSFPDIYGRTGAGCFVINGKAYIFGGKDELSIYKKDLWQFDPVANTWTQKTGLNNLQLPRAYVASFVLNNKGYIVGGERATPGPTGKELTETWEYDPVNDSWTQKASLPVGS